MAGRMGNERVTVQSLTVHAVDAERGLLLIKGAVPGSQAAASSWSAARPRHRPGTTSAEDAA